MNSIRDVIKKYEDRLWEANQINAYLTAIIIDAAMALSEAGRPDLGLDIKQRAGITVIGNITLPGKDV